MSLLSNSLSRRHLRYAVLRRGHFLLSALSLSILLLGLVLTPRPVRADGVTALEVLDPAILSGNYVNRSGWGPNSLLLGRDDSLYGTTVEGGRYGAGVIFRLSVDGQRRILHEFHTSDGSSPEGTLLQASDGALYGVTAEGGPHGDGVIFKITTEGHFSLLHAFSKLQDQGQNWDGAFPGAGLIQGNDGALYGTTTSGGRYGSGTVFRYSLVSPVGLTTLYSFSMLDSDSTNSDGGMPDASLIQGSDNAYYGDTFTGGVNGSGVVFRLTADGVYTVLHTFGPFGYNGGTTDGAAPTAGLVQGLNGALYGVTTSGGSGGDGNVFSVTTDGSQFTVLHNFYPPGGGLTNKDGESPSSPLLQRADGTFYGSTVIGGTRGSGTLFTITPGGDFTTLYNFGVRDASDLNLDGISPNSLTPGPDGYLYGSAYTGGSGRSGVIFRVGPSISGLDPGSTPAAQAFTLIVNGSGFYSGDTVLWNGEALTTTVVSPTQLTALVPLTVNTYPVQYPATVTVSVVAVSGFTVAAPLTITQPQPTLLRLLPSSLPAEQRHDVTLEVDGNGFITGSTVYWNGAPLSTTLDSRHRLLAVAPKALFAVSGTAQVTVVNPGSGGVSGALTFTITP